MTNQTTNLVYRGPLYDLAKTLSLIQFSDPFRELAKEFDDRSVGENIWHNMQLTPRAGHEFWLVKLFLGGKYRYIGVTERGTDAARFADMAAKRFAKYRKRLVKSEVVFNFSPEQVAFDEADCPAAVVLLGTIENYLLECGVIDTPGAEQKVKRAGRSIKGDMAFLESNILGRLESIEQKLASIERVVVPIYPPARTTPMYFPPEIIGPLGHEAPWIGDPPDNMGAPKSFCETHLTKP